MGKAKVRFDSFDPTAAADAAITGKASKGSVGSRTWDNSNSAKRPLNKVRGNNVKLDDIITTASFDGNMYLDLSTAEEFNYNEAWMWVFAFVDLNTTNDCILAYTSDNDGYIGIDAGGGGLVYKNNDARGVEFDIPTNNTDNSTISYTFGSDVEALIIYKPADSNVLNFYNIEGQFIATNSAAGNGTTFNLERLGASNSTSTEFRGEMLDARFYNGSDCPPLSNPSISAIGNRYKQYMN
jgi:hypothetical protein